MDKLNWVSEFVEKNGLAGTLLFLFVLKEVGFFRWAFKYFKRDDNEHPHQRYDDTNGTHSHKRFDDGEHKLLHDTADTLKSHLVEEAKEDIRMALIENKVNNLENNQAKTEEHVEKIFDLISQLRQSMIEMGYGRDR